ncbi:hypothetical protein F5Y18DRAFT_386197 [Xylariaceae sp. FL1019]|nr:hypothetical protein F5Y18DRAFT_386197 [Xylariaceae sp. FL1019]
MAIREDVVSSAVNFLQDPNVASSPLENKLSFLRSKNLTQEEIDAAFARTGASPPPASASPSAGPVAQQQQYYPQYPQQPPYGWQPPPHEPPRRDWRDWFIMATAVGGVGYGLYFLTKRYIYPLVAAPTPEKLEQDKASVDEKYAQAFATIEQLAKDTEGLKSSEQERVEKLDKIIDDMEKFVEDVKYSTRRQDEEMERMREDIKGVKDLVPKSMANHKDFTETRLKEISNEVKSLKSLITQRMTAPASAPAAASTPAPSHSNPTNNYLQSGNGSSAAASPAPATSPAPESSAPKENGTPAPAATKQDYMSSVNGRASPFSSGMPPAKASIPAWQLAASKSADTAGSSSQAGSSS